MKKLIALLLALPFIGFAQNTYVPDDNFEQHLINLGYDNVLDDYVSTAAIDTVTNLIILPSFYFYNLIGVEDFTALENLALGSPFAGLFLLEYLDLSNNHNLISLSLTHCDELKEINLKNGNNQNMTNVSVNFSDSLECVNVDDVVFASNSPVFSNIVVNNLIAYFSEDCSAGRVEGLVYYDADSSTTFNAGDNPLSNQVLELISASGGVQYLTTLNNGEFSSAVDSLESYTLSYYPPNNLTETSSRVSYSFNNIATDSVLNDLNFGVKGDGDYVDLGIYLTKSFTLCNDTALLTIDVVNHASTTVDGSFEVWLDSQTPVLAASGTPTITANHLLWNFTALQPFQNLQQTISYVVPANPGILLIDSALVSPTLVSGAIELNTFNNTAENQDIVFCSCDPNDKKIIPEQCYYAADDIMQHTIRFQNTGNYPAQKVRIVDTLDYAVLDVLSFQIIGASHAYTWEFKGSSILEITFDNIQLVDSSVSYVESQGFFKYQIKFKDNITALSESEMSAYIYFDNNQPVITNKPLAVYSENFNAVLTHSPHNLSVQITDGTLPFTYLWNTNEITQDINIQSSGNYWVIVTDANGCELDTLMYNVTGVGLDEINNERTLVRVIDLLGREIDITKNLPYASFFFIYDDGSVEKHIIIE
jgi:hypothetical protein